MKRLISAGLLFIAFLGLMGCSNPLGSDGSSPAPEAAPTYTVTYTGNGSTGGSVPTDGNTYLQGVTVLGNTGSLVKVSDGMTWTFTGWNTASDGSGTSYAAGAAFSMGMANVTLYAKWSAIGVTGPAGGIVFYDKGSYAAAICDNLSLGGFDDWFLPSKDELAEMYSKRGAIGGFEISSSAYWSSSEKDTNSARFKYFYSSIAGFSSKNAAYRVRAIRSF